VREQLRAARLVLRYIYRADRARSVAGIAITIATTVAGLLGAVVLKVLTDAALSGDERGVAVAAALLAANVAVMVAGNWATVTLSVGLRERATLYFDTRMAELTAGIHSLEHHERPEYLDEIFVLHQKHQQLADVQNAFVNNVSTMARLVLTVVLLARIHPLLILLPLSGIPSVLASIRIQRIRHRAEDRVAPLRRLVLTLFRIAATRDSAKEVRLYDLGDELLARSDAARDVIHDLEDRVDIQAAVLGGLGWLVFGLGFMAAMALVAREAVAGRASPGDVVLALTLAASVNWGVNGVANSVAWLLDNLKTGARLAWLEDLAAEAAARAAPADPAPVPPLLADGIRLEGVSFRYPGTAVEVLHDVDLFLPAGSTIAIVGDNGAGKTTLVKLLCRFYDPTEGRIAVDGTDLRRMDVGAWRQRLSGCFQDFARLELVAGESVGVGDLANIEDDSAIVAALDRAHAAEVPAALPDGLRTQLGRSFEGGTEPSTGQWQKLALARAMMRDEPLLLVLDEPTASLDALTEHALFERYAGAAARAARRSGAITILVSHRFSTVRMADLIVVFEHGRVAEIGTHAQLVGGGGTYAELYALQARSYR
jgi:ATP-binding cassette subfamily B protein